MRTHSLSTRALVAGGIAVALAAAPLAAWAAVRSNGATSSPSAASVAPAAPAAPIDAVADLEQQLAAGAPADRLVAFVHGDTAALAEAAATSAGLGVMDRFTRVGVVAAFGTPAQLRVAALQTGVRRVELDRPIQLALDTSHVATRGEEALRGFTVTTTETVATGKPKKKKPQPTTTITRTETSAPVDGSGVSIAIIDSGVDGTHPFFLDAEGNSKVVRNLKNLCVTGVLIPLQGPCVGEDGDAIDETFADVPTNDSDTGSAGGHGTHVAGIAGGGYDVLSDGRPLHGAAPGAKLVGISVGATLSVYGGSAGMNWVLEHHAEPCGPEADPVACPPIKVVNNSWGAGGGPYNPETVEAKLQDALVAEGVTVVWAAGNDGGDGSTIEIYGPNLSPTPGILSVANYDDQDTGTRDGGLDPSSSRGRESDTTTYPDLSAPGATITSSCRPYLPICYAHASTGDGNQRYFNLGGTSMAAPHIAGIVAQLLQADPTLTPGEIEDVLEDTAHKFTFGGAYVADPRNAGETTSFDKGHGLVDVKAAIARIRGITLSDEPGGAPASPCAGGVVAVDAAGDATEPTVDVTGADIEVARDAQGAVSSATFTIDAPELAEEYPATYNGYSFYVDFSIDGRPYYVGASRDMFNGESYSFGRPDPNASNIRSDMTSEGMTGSLTFGEGLSVTLTQAAIDDANTTLASDAPTPTPPLPPLADGLVLGKVVVLSTLQRNAVVVASLPAGDSADSGCTYTVGSGSAPNPPDAGGGDPTDPPPPTSEDVDGTLADGGSWEASGLSPADNTQYECTGPNDPKCVTYVLDLRPSTGSGSLDVTLEGDTIGTVIDDFDVSLYDLTGHEVASSGNPQTLVEGFTASITTGLYYLVVQPYLATTESPYTVAATLTVA